MMWFRKHLSCPFARPPPWRLAGVGSRARENATTRGEEYFEADLEIGFKVFSERYTSAVTCARPERVTARSVSSGLFKSMTTTWRFQNLSDAASEEGRRRRTMVWDYRRVMVSSWILRLISR